MGMFCYNNLGVIVGCFGIHCCVIFWLFISWSSIVPLFVYIVAIVFYMLLICLGVIVKFSCYHLSLSREDRMSILFGSLIC